MTFPLRFLICNGFIALLLGAFLLLKKLFRRHMTIHTQYVLWWVFLFALALPFLPSRLIFPEWLLSWKGEGLLDGSVRVLPVAAPAVNTVDRIVELVPDVVDKVSGFIRKKTEEPEL